MASRGADSELQEASAPHKTNTKLEAGVERMTAGPFLRQLRLEGQVPRRNEEEAKGETAVVGRERSELDQGELPLSSALPSLHSVACGSTANTQLAVSLQ